ncbi:YgiQ family radical SAM protein [Anaerofustis sp. NSJ-163]|uniref:YgiQ family radical SAM protein n=1 Tax=Anaerofustis sp. NSJ-163 TaxID=2944391 RepID=UPI00209C55EB|nr:YgiQ family radical SAM protein [Anaerofustis sp. NSJ-163]MCO8193847.1 YgiQ family radical SAM protein [Anaerofustis sp. NSJ-163]
MKINNEFLITTKKEMEERGISQLDFIIVTGDAYIDHPSFGTAIIGRHLESLGFSIGVIPQPNWKEKESFMVLGRPKYAFLVNSGNIDSMVNHYTASKKKRNDDVYTEGGVAGKRPDRAVIVYCNMIRMAYKKVNIIIGGIEASLRRFAHYDYWDNKVRHSILTDSTADMLTYGSGEKILGEIATRLKNGENLKDITDVKGSCYMTSDISNIEDAIIIPSYKEVCLDKEKYNKAFKVQYQNQDPITGKTIIQFMDKTYLVQNPPMMPLNREELDKVYGLSYARKPHPMYKKEIPAIKEIEFSVTSNRGCFGNCSFCALTFHQGRMVQSRSKKSIIDEVKLLTKIDGFKGYIHDIGGPTANFKNPSCQKQMKYGTCVGINKTCLSPSPCKNLEVDHSEFLDVLRAARNVKNVKKVFVRSGIRYDYLLLEKDPTVLKELVKHHISGQLKIAPEHINNKTLKQMGKPGREVYEKFVDKYNKVNKELGMKQYLVPYFISSHPGCTIQGALELALYMKKHNIRPRQVQDFYPTPGTLSTCMFYTGKNPLTNEKVFVPKTYEEKQTQRAFMQYYKPENKERIRKALIKIGRTDLIGPYENCLVFEKREFKNNKNNKRKTSSKKLTNKSGKGKPNSRKRRYK